MTEQVESLIGWLRAAGEPTRLRLLALLRERDLSVGELVSIIGQSQPRLSHHLKTLALAGLVERLPEGSFVFYRTASRGVARRFLDELFGHIDAADPVLTRDRAHLAAVTHARQGAAETYFSGIADRWDEIRALHSPNAAIEQALLDLAGKRRFGRLVDFGTGTGRMLTLFAPRADAAEGLDRNHGMLTIARSQLEKAGLAHARVRQGDVTATPFEAQSADLVIIHQVLHFMDTPGQAIAEAARILRSGGVLLVVDFAPHALEFLRAEHGHHRLGIRHDALQAWAETAGLKIAPPLEIAPPDAAVNGLTVNIWKAIKPHLAKEKAA
jgi:ubiquinone/menaquinone biosynthesis C-methylase UbiE/DNA-binding transcriptional ArsR family regulator